MVATGGSIRRRHNSFVEFAASALSEDERIHRTPPPIDEVRLTNLWDRIAHVATLVGYGLMLSFFNIVVLASVAAHRWTTLSPAGVSVVDATAVVDGIFLPFMIGILIAAVAVVGQSDASPHSGPKYSSCTALVGVVVFPLFYAIGRGLSRSTDTKYYGLDLLFCGLLAVVAHLVLEFTGRKRWLALDRRSSASLRAGESELVSVGFATAPLEKAAVAKAIPKYATLLNIVPLVAGVCIGFLYPFFILPQFFSSGISTRLLICLVLHPLLLEGTEAVSRALASDAVLRQPSDVTTEVAERRVVQKSTKSFFVKMMMAYFRRFMLLNMGSPTVTTYAVVAASIEEALSRGFIVDCDSFLRRRLGKPKPKGRDLRLQRLVWMCDINQSAIAEFIAIITASVAQIVLERLSLVFALGYEVGASLDVAVVFVLLLAELALELLVDNVAMWAESEHGIPVTHYFATVRSPLTFVYHGCAASSTLYIALFCLIRHPFFLSCSSSYVCECLDQPRFEALDSERCAAAAALTNTSRSSDDGPEPGAANVSVFDGVDPTTLVLAFVTPVELSIGMLALIGLSVLFARYRKQQSAVVAGRV